MYNKNRAHLKSCTRHEISGKIMKFRNLLAAMFVAIAFCSCTTFTKMVQSSPVMARNVELDPIKADIEVYQDQKLTGEGMVKYFLCFQLNGLKEQKMVMV